MMRRLPQYQRIEKTEAGLWPLLLRRESIGAIIGMCHRQQSSDRVPFVKPGAVVSRWQKIQAGRITTFPRARNDARVFASWRYNRRGHKPRWTLTDPQRVPGA